MTRNKLFLFGLIFVLAAMTIGACGGEEIATDEAIAEEDAKADLLNNGSVYNFVEKDSGKTITAYAGSTINVKLQGALSAGYVWEVVKTNSLLRLAKQDVTGSIYNFKFSIPGPAAGGVYTIKLAYYRQGESQLNAARYFVLKVKVPAGLPVA